MTTLPSVFVSSTFYDLKHLRNTLRSFLEDQLGYRPRLSEHESFPVEPDLDAVANCRRAVADDADVFVLVVGGRYGHVCPHRGVSITNLEYETARTKGIPIIVFIDRTVLAVLPTWKANPEVDFSATVTDTRVFDFVARIRDVDSVWIHEFSTPDDVVRILRNRLATLMHDGLSLLRRLRDASLDLTDLSASSMRLVLERASGWAPLLLASVLRSEMRRSHDLRVQFNAGIILGRGEIMHDLSDTFRWLSAKLEEAHRLMEGTTKLINETLASALSSDDPRGVIESGHQIGLVYRDSLEWAQSIRRAHVSSEAGEVVREASNMIVGLVERLSELPDQIEAEIRRCIESGTTQAHLRFEINVPNEAAVNELLDEMRQRLGSE